MQDFEKKSKPKAASVKKPVKDVCGCKKREEQKAQQKAPLPKKKTLKKKPNESEKSWSISNLFK